MYEIFSPYALNKPDPFFIFVVVQRKINFEIKYKLSLFHYSLLTISMSLTLSFILKTSAKMKQCRNVMAPS